MYGKIVKKTLVTLFAAAAAGFALCAAASAADIRTYSVPDGVEMSDHLYSVRVRPEGGDESEWKDVPVMRVQVNNQGAKNAGFSYFDSDSPVEVEVTCKELEGGLTEETAVYPKSLEITPEFSAGDDTVRFTAEPGDNIVLDPNGDTRRSLHIYAGEIQDIPTPEETERSGKTVEIVDASEGDMLSSGYDADVVYVKPGFYTVDVRLKSDQIWYFEGGAVINGSISLSGTENAKLIGRGLIYRPWHLAMAVDNTENAYIDGMMAANYGWGDNGGYLINISNSKNVTIKNVKSVARHKWGDGIDIFTSENISIEDCFIRSNDDCIAVYGPRWTGQYWGDTGNVRNIKVTGCTLMPDTARPIHFGTHGDSSSPNGGRVIDNCTFEDIDILTYNKYAMKTDGSGNPAPMSIHMDACEGNKITNVFFENIRIQDGCANKLVVMLVKTQGRYGTETVPGRGIDNVYFKDIYYNNPDPAFDGEISGWGKYNGEDAATQNVTFENLAINGETAKSAEDAHIEIGNYARNIRFIGSGEDEYRYDPSAVPEDFWQEYTNSAVAASADISENGSDPSAVLDDDTGTIWYSQVGAGEPQTLFDEGRDSELKGLTLDLGEERHINGVRITWDRAGGGYLYRIFVSKDGVTWGEGRSDEHAVGAVNPKSGADYWRVKWTWFANQEEPIIGRYVKIVPCDGQQLAIDKAEVYCFGD